MLADDRIAALGALLFAAGEPVARERLAALLELPVDELEPLLDELARRASMLGLVLVQHGARVELATAPEHGPLVARLLGSESSRLSAAALETLAIVAYLQPVTRSEIEAIRGVDSTAALQTLLAHGLVEPVGRRAAPGQPVEYGTTASFLERFGLRDLGALPALPSEVAELLAARRDGR
ncbi:MAG: SMC-Scp complex subunit ScpB [Thermomicrobium sp.]|nr:SMC-Scp complex subunit ScpB [Thermomicrobium sp.]MDW8060482.1 SMC-Scp complex subunit ScpB [Thermomicrobium sp.]